MAMLAGQLGRFDQMVALMIECDTQDEIGSHLGRAA
jgi:hypothetical protein